MSFKIILQKNRYFIVVFIIVFASLFSGLFFYDIGLNSKYFIRRAFQDAFLARQTGNCEKFRSYNLHDVDAWFERCIDERDLDKPPIQSFSIKEITIKGSGAFLQVELQRDTYSIAVRLATDGHKIPEGGYLVHYRMKRINGGWFIDQEVD